MDHPRIDEEQILDRYLVGRLSAEEEALFEEHLFECADCLEKARWGEELRRGLHEAAAQETVRAAAHTTLWVALLAWLRQRPARRAGLAVLGLALVWALVVLPVVVLRQHSELRQLRQAALAPDAESGGLTRPVSDFRVVSLGVVRGGGPTELTEAGETELRPDPTKPDVLLSIELATAGAERYRVTLGDDAGHVLWRGDDLEPTLYDTLLVALPSSFLEPGRYRISVDGLTAGGVEPAGEVRLRVLPGRE